MPTKTDFSLYKAAVLKHWFALIGFFVFTLIASIKIVAETIFGSFVMPSWIYYVAAAICVFLAQFLAWLDMKKERDTLRAFNVTEDVLKKIGEYRSELIAHQNKPIKTEEELGQWKEQFLTLKKEISEHIGKNVSEAEKKLFDRYGRFTKHIFGDELQIEMEIEINGKKQKVKTSHPTHVQYKSMIVRDYEFLYELVKDYARQRGWKSERFLGENDV